MEKNTYKKPKFRKDTEHNFSDLRNKALELVKERETRIGWQIKLKAVIFPLLYFAVYTLLLLSGQQQAIFYLAYMLLGVLLVLNFLNLIHDAAHEVIFKNKSLNRAYMYLFDIMGANSYIWKIRHIRLHHAFPNVMNWDSDFEQSPLVRVFPQAQAREIHKYQHIYLPFLYPMYLFNWLLIRDFKDFFSHKTIVSRIIKIPKSEYIKLFFFKTLFFAYILLIPKLVLGFNWSVIFGGFFLMLLTASLISLLVLLSPHANTESDFPEVGADGQLPYGWVEHQLRCTNDVSNDNFFIRFFMGSFNYHIAHHLFPNVHHMHYPALTELIKEFAAQNGLPYRRQSLGESLMAHYRLLQQNAAVENIFEETM